MADLVCKIRHLWGQQVDVGGGKLIDIPIGGVVRGVDEAAAARLLQNVDGWARHVGSMRASKPAPAPVPPPKAPEPAAIVEVKDEAVAPSQPSEVSETGASSSEDAPRPSSRRGRR